MTAIGFVLFTVGYGLNQIIDAHNDWQAVPTVLLLLSGLTLSISGIAMKLWEIMP